MSRSSMQVYNIVGQNIVFGDVLWPCSDIVYINLFGLYECTEALNEANIYEFFRNIIIPMQPYSTPMLATFLISSCS